MSESATARLELEGGKNAPLEMPEKLPPELEGHLSSEDYESRASSNDFSTAMRVSRWWG